MIKVSCLLFFQMTILQLMGYPSSVMIGFTVAVYELGCMVGALITGRLSDMVGRKNTIRIGCTILIISVVLQTATQNLAVTIVARVIAGIGNSMNTTTIPIYQFEISPPPRVVVLTFASSVLYSLSVL